MQTLGTQIAADLCFDLLGALVRNIISFLTPFLQFKHLLLVSIQSVWGRGGRLAGPLSGRAR